MVAKTDQQIKTQNTDVRTACRKDGEWKLGTSNEADTTANLIDTGTWIGET